MLKVQNDAMQQVNKILEKRKTQDDNAADLARSLVKFSLDIYGDKNRFIYELLQNANDSAILGANVQVAFAVVEGRWLVVSHDGKGFNEADLSGLTSVGVSSDKRENADAIGYKGIGFKSVFAVSEWVYIESGDYRFRFDRSAWPYPSKTPWQIIPIWTEPANVPEAVRDHLAARPSHVAFAIRLRDDFDVVACLQNTFRDPNILLFLTRVAALDLVLPIPCRLERQVSDQEIAIHRDGKVESRWLTRTFTFDVPTELRQKLAQNEDYPEKLRNATQASINFAASLDANGQLNGKRHPVYTFLPTDVNLELPFVINGNFVLTASRQSAQDSDPWNAFLFQHAGGCTATWLAELAGTPTYRVTFTRLLPSASIHGGNERLHGLYTPVFEAAFKQLAVARIVTGKLVKLERAIWDTTGVLSALGDVALKQFNDLHLIDPEVEHLDKLVRLGLIKIGTDRLEEMLTSCASALSDPRACLNVITALHTTVGQHAQSLALLKALPWVLDGQGALRAPKDVYLPPKNGMLSAELRAFGLSFHFLHPVLAAQPAAVEWLTGLGVRAFNKMEFLRGSVLPAIDNGQMTEANALAIGHFVFECMSSLESKDLVSLRKLPLRVKGGGLKPAMATWLSSEYEPDEPIEDLLGQTAAFSFVDPSYMRPGETAFDWRLFFKQIGVSSAIAIQYQDNLHRSVLEAAGELHRAYLEFLDNHHYDPIFRRYTHQHVVNHFPYTAVVDHLTTPAISRLFWAAVIPVWGTALFESDYLVFNRTRTIKVPSFVRYLLQHQPIVPTTDGTCQLASEVYHRSPKLEMLIGTNFPLTDLGKVKLTATQAHEVGLKTELTLSDALTLLECIANEPWSDVQRSRLEELYGWFAGHSLTKSHRRIVRDWCPRARFLAQDNAFRPAQELCLIFSDKRLNAEAPERFLKFHGKPSSFDRAADFFALAGIRVIRDSELVITLEGPREEMVPRQTVLQRIPLLALTRPDLTEPLADAIRRMKDTIANTTFVHCEGCTVSAGADMRLDLVDEAWLSLGRLNYRGDWQSPLTRYSLMDPLCELLGLHSQERLVELLLSLSPADGLAWLETQGLEVASVRALLVPATVETASAAVETTEDTEDTPDTDTAEPSGIESWTPESDWADVPVACYENDFSLSRSADEAHAFAERLTHMLDGIRSPWAGWIYHFTHLENALDILATGTLRSRAMVGSTAFKDAAGQHLIHRTSDDVKQFARFYFRPLTPTQWHNECLGRRHGGIRALCPVPVFFRLNLEDVLRVHGLACAVSNGNLAASASCYGNSTSFLAFFDNEHVYRAFGEIDLQTYFRACQQEFLVHGSLRLREVGLEIVCRNEQDRLALVNQLTPAHGVLPESVRVDGSLFFNDNPAVQLRHTADGLVVGLSSGAATDDGTMCVRINGYDARGRYITSTRGRIAMVHAGEDLWVHSHGDVIIPDYTGQTLDVTYKEQDTEWVIFKGRF